MASSDPGVGDDATFYQVLPDRPRRLYLNARRRRRSYIRYVALYATLVMLAATIFISIPAMAQVGLNPGPDDGLPLEEYERRVEGWCSVLIRDWGWTRDVDGSVTGWEGGCWRDDGRPSHQECLDMGFEWDCPIPGDSQVADEVTEEVTASGSVDDGDDMPLPTVIEAGSGGLQ